METQKLKLNQVIAIEKGVKSRVYGDITKMDKTAQPFRACSNNGADAR